MSWLVLLLFNLILSFVALVGLDRFTRSLRLLLLTIFISCGFGRWLDLLLMLWLFEFMLLFFYHFNIFFIFLFLFLIVVGIIQQSFFLPVDALEVYGNWEEINEEETQDCSIEFDQLPETDSEQCKTQAHADNDCDIDKFLFVDLTALRLLPTYNAKETFSWLKQLVLSN